MASYSSNLSDQRHEVHRDTRIEDYLNDKLQTHADLASIDALLQDLNNQHALLSQQLEESKETLKKTTQESHQHRENVLQQAKAFRAQQSDIDRRLRIVTQSDTSDEAIQKFEKSMSVLQNLDVAYEYMELLRRVEDLSTEARSNFSKSPHAALKPYISLQNLVNALRAAQPAAEDAAPHLVDHVDKAARSLWKQMKDAFASDFEKTLQKLHWPGKDVKLHGSLEEEWIDGVKKLLDLQGPEFKARDSEDVASSSHEGPLVLLPLEVMFKPLELRFKYHFEGDRPTNKLDKPEYFLSHVESLLSTYEEFFASHLQPILRTYFKDSDLRSNSIYIDSTSALITAALPMLRHKIFTIMPNISKQPQLLSHFIHELMGFDVRLRDDWNYDAGSSVQGWKGLTWEVLDKKGWFHRWLEVEKNFALNRYNDIIRTPESHDIDYDSVETSATKPTYAAIRVNDLLETITDRYRPLTSFSQKLQFLIGIQIEIFDMYHNRLLDSLSKYQASLSTLGRTIQGESRESASEVFGLKGIEHLCRIYGSAEYLEKKMRDWSDDVFFLELYDELQDRITNRPGKALAGPMSVEAVAERTSSTVVTSNGDDTRNSGALFDETATSYKRLRIRTESLLIDALVKAIKEAFPTYSNINPWSSLSSYDQQPGLTVNAELDPTFQVLTSYLSFLSKVLARPSLRRIGRQLALSIQTLLWDTVLMRYTFSAAGIAQFTRDVHAIWDVLDRYLGSGQGAAGMRRLQEALVLMGLPASQPSTDANSTKGDDEGFDAWTTEDDGPQEEKDEQEGKVEEASSDAREQLGIGLGLWEVEKRVFRNNESAREVLEELGLESLSETDARHVMERIIEVGGT